MRRSHKLWVASLLAPAASMLFACSAGTIGGFNQTSTSGPGSGAGSGAGGSGSPVAAGSGAGASGAGSGAATTPPATDGGTVLNLSNVYPSSYGWYDSLIAADCTQPAALPPTRIWRLSALQWTNTVQASFNLMVSPTQFPGDTVDPATGYSDNSTDNMITQPLAQAYFDVGKTIAVGAASAATTAYACLGTAPITSACASQFVSDYGARLFRRALTSAESMVYVNFLTSQSMLDPAATAVASTIRAMLLSPNFEYRTELGTSTPGPVTLTGFEIASLLSYTIADIPPDAPLIQAANAGMLTDATVRETQARRLEAMPGAQAKMQDFWQQYLTLGAIPATTGITAAVGQSMVNETETFFNKVVWGTPAGKYSDLLTANYTYGDTNVAKIYGTALPDSTGKIALPAGQRAGFLTQASTLVQSAAPSQAATVIHRGLRVRERLLCETPPPPPPGFTPNPAMIMTIPNATAAQNYAAFAMADPMCNACHQNFQPLGLGFEVYDGLGNYRTSYPAPIGQPIVTTGTLTAAGDANGAYNDVIQLASNIGKSKIGQYCFTDQFAMYALGRNVDLSQEACTVRGMGDFVTANNGAIRDLFASLAHVDSEYRRFFQ
jgi:hypothetical protein